jgi:hypothetical protein
MIKNLTIWKDIQTLSDIKGFPHEAWDKKMGADYLELRNSDYFMRARIRIFFQKIFLLGIRISPGSMNEVNAYT